MSYIIAVPKLGYDVIDETDPQNFVFHSSYNTFKIVRTGIKEMRLVGSTAGQTFYEPHRLSFTPLVTAFAKHIGYDHIFPANTAGIYLWGAKAGIFNTGVKFVSVAANAINVIFKFDNTLGGGQTVRVRYYCLETI